MASLLHFAGRGVRTRPDEAVRHEAVRIQSVEDRSGELSIHPGSYRQTDLSKLAGKEVA
jgi:hypothetical protein